MKDSNSLESYIEGPLPIKSELLTFFKRNAKLTIFDIGSCEAEDSIRYSLLFPNSQIHSFEPLPKNVEKAITNINKWNIQNIKLNALALSNKSGKAILHVSEGKPDNVKEDESWDYGNKSSSLLQPGLIRHIHKWLTFNNKIEVNTTTIYEYCKINNINSIDLMHLDVQGTELLVLEGAKDILKQTKLIWLEVENISLYKDQPLKRDTQKFMKEHNFRKIKDTVNDVSGDQLYVNKDCFNTMIYLNLKLNINFTNLFKKFNKKSN